VTQQRPAREPAGGRRAAVGWLWRAFAALVVAFRLPIPAGWIAAAVLATLYLPAVSASGSLGGLVSSNSPAVRAELDAARLFGVPLASAEVDVVQRDPAGFPPDTRRPSAVWQFAGPPGPRRGASRLVRSRVGPARHDPRYACFVPVRPRVGPARPWP
jgi:hypothetical protein